MFFRFVMDNFLSLWLFVGLAAAFLNICVKNIEEQDPMITLCQVCLGPVTLTWFILKWIVVEMFLTEHPQRETIVKSIKYEHKKVKVEQEETETIFPKRDTSNLVGDEPGTGKTRA